MKKTILAALLLASLFTACKKDETAPNADMNDSTAVLPVTSTENKEATDKEQITQLIRKTLIWAEDKTPDLLPGELKEGDTIYSGVDFKTQDINLKKVANTGLFTKDFIDNCKKIATTIDKKIKANEYQPWDSREMPPFNIYNDVNPWYFSQDPGEWNKVETKVISLDNNKGELQWRFETRPENDASWKEFSYTFRVMKENGSWKISYMQGFDYNEAIKGF